MKILIKTDKRFEVTLKAETDEEIDFIGMLSMNPSALFVTGFGSSDPISTSGRVLSEVSLSIDPTSAQSIAAESGRKAIRAFREFSSLLRSEFAE